LPAVTGWVEYIHSPLPEGSQDLAVYVSVTDPTELSFDAAS
jgi:hypothetical protein